MPTLAVPVVRPKCDRMQDPANEEKDVPENREEIDHDEPYLDEREELAVSQHRGLSAVSVYTVVFAEGKEELERPLTSLWWSGVAAGLAISASILAEGILHHIYADHPYRVAIENLGYTVGFILVILGRMQLFTENTITPILPLLREKSGHMLFCTARLWGIVFVANLVGTFITAAVSYHLGTAPDEYLEGMMGISRHFNENSLWDGFVLGIPAGFFIASIVWLLPSSKGFEIFTIFLLTYLIAIGDFTHVIAGSGELFLLVVAGEETIWRAFALIFTTLCGNVLGGTGLFALLAYGQVAQELEDRDNKRQEDERKERSSA